MLNRLSTHFATTLNPSEAHMGFMWGPRVSSSSVWVVVSGVSAFVALFRTSPRCHHPSKPPLVKKGGRRHGGEALKIYSIVASTKTGELADALDFSNFTTVSLDGS